jgi:hypothetical protein
MLGNLMNDLDLKSKPQNIWNCDESGFQCDPSSKKILCKTGMREPFTAISNGEKATYTTLSCCNANGLFLPPLIIFKATNLWDQWCKDGPVGASYNTSENN